MPVCQKLVLVQFCPRLNQALLSLRKSSGEQRNWRNTDDGGVFLVIGMEMSFVMSFSGLNKHPNNDAIKP
jgi:hypothetical protein